MPQDTILRYFAPGPPKAGMKGIKITAIDTSNTSPNVARIQEPLGQYTATAEIVKLNKTEYLHDLTIPSHLPNAALVTVALSHIPQLKNIMATLLPIRYPDKFFNECLQDETVAQLCYVALYDSKVVGWIRCRLEPFPSAENMKYNQVYIQALGLLAPYRGNGLASALLDKVITRASSLQQNVHSIYAHVWEVNSDALEWYEKRGFRKIILVQQYYRKLRPAGAWIVRKEIP